MESSKLLRKKLLKVLLAAVCGAGFCVTLIVLDNLADWMWRRGHLSSAWNDFFTGLAWLLILPASGATPQGHDLLNLYFVDGALGAIIFAGVAAFWQFLVKTSPREQTGTNN